MIYNLKRNSILAMKIKDYIEKDLKEYIITIGAQEYLKDFYVSFDFKPVSDIYDEDGIKHLDMQRKCLGATE